tara:strand:- start:5106 stop:5582 length:477 start_codon:yes stop_codon:yes gene_type:complete
MAREPISMPPTLPNSVDNWTEEVEEFVRYIEKKCDDNNDEHMASGLSKKGKHIILALPPAVIGSLMAPLVSKFEDDEWMNIVSPLAFAAIAVTSVMATFFNFSKKSEQHFNYAARYSELSTDIKEQLAKSHDDRLKAEVFTMAIKVKYNFLNGQSPIH